MTAPEAPGHDRGLRGKRLQTHLEAFVFRVNRCRTRFAAVHSLPIMATSTGPRLSHKANRKKWFEVLYN